MLGLEPDITIIGEAADGREAIELARRERPAVMLLDIAMPGMDGLEAIPYIREASPDTRIVILSGFSNEELKRRARDAGAWRYVEKGADPDTITAVIRNACGAGAG